MPLIILCEPSIRVTQGVVRQRKVHHRAVYQGSTEEESDSDSNYSDSEEEITEQVKQSDINEEDDDDDWMKFQEEAKKENMLETKSKETHVVHCPYYPLVSYQLSLLPPGEL